MINNYYLRWAIGLPGMFGIAYLFSGIGCLVKGISFFSMFPIITGLFVSLEIITIISYFLTRSKKDKEDKK